MDRLIEGLWDCRQCGTKGIGGSKRQCPNCGKARDRNTKFYLPSERIYISQEEAKKINRNPNWVCLHCNEQLNSDDDKFCKSCGAMRTSENVDYFGRKEQESDEQSQQESFFEIVSDQTSENDEIGKISPKTNRKIRLNINWKTIGIAFLLIILLGTMVYAFIPKIKEITVTEVGWNRVINIERFQTIDENDWTLPAGARLKYQEQEFHHNEQVVDYYETKTRQVANTRISRYETYSAGTRDLGNGYFEEVTGTRPVYETYYETETYQDPVYKNVPVYKTKYYYEIDRWLPERSIETFAKNKSPYWGEVKLKNDERESSRQETYFIVGTEKDEKQITIKLLYSEWILRMIGEELKIKVDVLGNGKIEKD